MKKETAKSTVKASGGRALCVLLPVLYAGAEALALILLKFLEIRGGYPQICTTLMYGAIVLNTAVVILLAGAAVQRCRLSRSALFAALGLILTLAADTVLVLLNRWYLLGVLLFCGVQTLYAVAIGATPGKGGKQAESAPDARAELRMWLIRLGSFLAVLLVLIILKMAQPLNIASGYSITQLTINVFTAWRKRRALQSQQCRSLRSGWLLFALGLTLFWGCDMCVGIYNLSYGAAGLETLYAASGFLIWIFYLPSQVLLVFAESCFLHASGQDQNHQSTSQ